jgi:primary-amine oxidase
MATQTVSDSLPTRVAKHISSHPLAPISAAEIKEAVSHIKARWPAHTDLHFKAITLEEPAKAETVRFLEAEFEGSSLPSIDRRVFVTYYLRKTVSHSSSLPDACD